MQRGGGAHDYRGTHDYIMLSVQGLGEGDRDREAVDHPAQSYRVHVCNRNHISYTL